MEFTRRVFLGGMAAMAGDGLRKPLNAPAAQPPAYGTQPGAPGPVIATQVIITGGKLLAYAPSPGANNLLASTAAVAGTDTFGNAYFAGFTTYGKSGLTYYALSQLPGTDAAGTFGAAVTVYTATSQAGPWTAGTQLGFLSANGLDLIANTFDFFAVSGVPTLRLSHGTNLSAAAAFITATAQGVLNVQDQNGLSGTLPIVQADVSTHAVGNTGTAGDITKSWAVPANDGVQGTTYTIKALATMSSGATTAETLTIGVDIDGTQTALATLGASFNGSALSTGYDIPLELALTVDAVSAGVPQVYLLGPLGDTSANRLATNSANMSGHSNTTSWDKTVSHTLAVYAQWGGAGGTGQNIQTIASRLYREGP